MAVEQFSRSLPMMLYRALDAVMPRFRAIFRQAGLTEPQWRVLRVLWEVPEIGSRALGELTLIPAPSLVGVLDRLERAGLLERRRSSADRRVVMLAVTPEGARIEAEVMSQVASAYADLKLSIEPAVWQGLLHGLQQLAAVEARPKARRR